MKKIIAILMVTVMVLALCGCRESQRASYNISKEADNFNCIRTVTVINGFQGDILFTMTGRMSINADVEDNQLEIVVEHDKGKYKKHIIGLSDNTTYVVEDITGANVSKYHYELNYNPKMWAPVTLKYSD